MLSLRKVTFGTFFVGSLVLLSASMLRTPLATFGPGGTSSGFADAALNRADAAISSFSASIPDAVKAFPHEANVFLRRNATTARLEFEGMKNAVSSHLNLSSWLGGSGRDLVQNGTQIASKVDGNKARTLARKVPLVNSAMDATRDRVNAVSQSVTNSSLGF